MIKKVIPIHLKKKINVIKKKQVQEVARPLVKTH